MINDADPVPAEDRGKPGAIGDIEKGERAGFSGRVGRNRDETLSAVPLPQRRAAQPIGRRR
jgi:hypothetical protein